MGAQMHGANFGQAPPSLLQPGQQTWNPQAPQPQVWSHLSATLVTDSYILQMPNLSQPAAQSGQRVQLPAGSLTAAPAQEPMQQQQQPAKQSGFGGLLANAKADFHGLEGVDM